jgi:hypothetical protein
MSGSHRFPDQPRRKAGPSATRSQTLRRTAAVKSVLAGNARAMTHGIRSELVTRPDVQTEIALLYAANPGLDPIADRRLVELAAMTNVRLVRCVLALDEQGHDRVLTAYFSKLAPLAERLERQLNERVRQRVGEGRTSAPDPLAQYKRPRAAW